MKSDSKPNYTILEVQELDVNYGGIQALKKINLIIQKGEVVTLIGANGAGKTTTLRAISKVVNPKSGVIIYNGHNITRRQTHEVVQLGIAHCPEGRRVLTRQTVFDNLLLGAYIRSNQAEIKADIQHQFELFPRLSQRRNQLAGTLSGGEQQMLAIARAEIKADIQHQFELFPRLSQRRNQLAGTLSGGEQQMLAIARAVMSKPQLLLLDEPSLGLAPAIVREIFSIIENLRATGVTILLVEQNG